MKALRLFFTLGGLFTMSFVSSASVPRVVLNILSSFSLPAAFILLKDYCLRIGTLISVFSCFLSTLILDRLVNAGLLVFSLSKASFSLKISSLDSSIVDT